jgi:hypothetical protein
VNRELHLEGHSFVVLGGIILPSKGALIRALSVAPEPEWELRSLAQTQPMDLGVGGVVQVLGGWVRAHPPDVAPELVSELETRSRAFICNCSCCSLGGFVGAVMAVVVTWAQLWTRGSRPT